MSFVDQVQSSACTTEKHLPCLTTNIPFDSLPASLSVVATLEDLVILSPLGSRWKKSCLVGSHQEMLNPISGVISCWVKVPFLKCPKFRTYVGQSGTFPTVNRLFVFCFSSFTRVTDGGAGWRGEAFCVNTNDNRVFAVCLALSARRSWGEIRFARVRWWFMPGFYASRRCYPATWEAIEPGTSETS